MCRRRDTPCAKVYRSPTYHSDVHPFADTYPPHGFTYPSHGLLSVWARTLADEGTSGGRWCRCEGTSHELNLYIIATYVWVQDPQKISLDFPSNIGHAIHTPRRRVKEVLEHLSTLYQMLMVAITGLFRYNRLIISITGIGSNNEPYIVCLIWWISVCTVLANMSRH